MFKTLLTLSLSLSMSVAAFAAPKTAGVPLEHAYVPAGYDSNDNIEILIRGNLPNLCYKSPKSIVKTQGDLIEIEVYALFEENPEVACAEVLVPFLHSAVVGVLGEGKYNVRVKSNNLVLIEDTLDVKLATNLEVNDNIYAGVDYVERVGDTRKILLKGWNPSGCLEFDRIEFSSNNKDTFAVLPIMKRVDDFCDYKMMPFEYETEVPTTLDFEKILLHVRTITGDSYNTLFDNSLKISE
jgi:hypothetical protein